MRSNGQRARYLKPVSNRVGFVARGDGDERHGGGGGGGAGGKASPKRASADGGNGDDGFAEEARAGKPGVAEHLLIGQSLAASGDHENAVTYYEREWELSRSADVPLALGTSLTELGRDDEARPWLDLARRQPKPDAAKGTDGR